MSVRTSSNREELPCVVIDGAGFGGLNAAWSLRHAPVQVTVIDRRNHHLFQPLLYSSYRDVRMGVGVCYL